MHYTTKSCNCTRTWSKRQHWSFSTIHSM